MTATASSANLDFVRSLGADEVIDYRAERFEDMVRHVDVVFDTVGGETLERSWSVLSGRQFELNKRRQLFIGANHETLLVIAVSVSNEDCSPARIYR